MAKIVNTAFVKQIAFQWDSTTRVFQMDSMRVNPVEDSRIYTLSNGNKKSILIHLWLEFDISFRYAKRISPNASVNNDLIDVINNINDPNKAVTLYPIYNIDNTVNYEVIKNGNLKSIITIDRFKNIPQFNMKVITNSSMSSYPTWLRNTRIL